MNKKVTILGAGSWGSANAIQLAKKDITVILWARNKENINEMNISRENTKYLPGIKFPDALILTSDLDIACKGADIIVLGTPSHTIRGMAEQLKTIINKNQIIVSLAKGIENESLLRMSQVLEEILPMQPIAVLSGPSHAEELGRDMPTTVVVSAKTKEIAQEVQDIFMSQALRVYTNSDIIGVELGGALKNIIALGAGIIDGLGYGDNTKAAIMTRGIVEIARLGVALGAQKETFAGLAGIGDLIVTCTSMHSRNRRAGIAIGQGQTLEQVIGESKMVVEGIKTTKSAYDLANKLKIDMPITTAIYDVLYNNVNITEIAGRLMSRNKKHESEDISILTGENW